MTNQESAVFIKDTVADTMTREEFFGDIIGNLANTLEATVGLEESEGFITDVGTCMGEQISTLYDTGDDVSRAYMARILVDLKARIGGDFHVKSIDEDRIVLSNSRCPFGDRVVGKQSLCMMTTNVFGQVVADRNGYAHIEVEDSIAENGQFCSVIVTLKPSKAPGGVGFEFFS